MQVVSGFADVEPFEILQPAEQRVPFVFNSPQIVHATASPLFPERSSGLLW